MFRVNAEINLLEMGHELLTSRIANKLDENDNENKSANYSLILLLIRNAEKFDWMNAARNFKVVLHRMKRIVNSNA